VSTKSSKCRGKIEHDISTYLAALIDKIEKIEIQLAARVALDRILAELSFSR
jgi:hypothetical protein